MPEVEAAILEATAGRDWTPHKVQEGVIEATLQLRNHVVVVQIHYDTDSFQIEYSRSENLNYRSGADGERIHPNYNSWIANLSSDISKRLAEFRAEPPRQGTPARAEDLAGSRFGTCFAAAPDGRFLTAAHVVEKADTIAVAAFGDAFAQAEVLFSDREIDIAVLKVSRPTPNYLRLAPPGSVAVGDHVFTWGFPVPELLGTDPKYADGAVSAFSTRTGAAGLIQMTVPIQPGSSGSPLLNERGEVVGVVTSTAAVATFFSQTGTFPQGLNFAISTDLLADRYSFGPDEAAAISQEVPLQQSRAETIERTRAAICVVRADVR